MKADDETNKLKHTTYHQVTCSSEVKAAPGSCYLEEDELLIGLQSTLIQEIISSTIMIVNICEWRIYL